MTTDVEDIIRKKEYFELNAQELEAVREYAASQEEYDEMRWFMKNVSEAFDGEKIVASAGLRTKVMSHLAESQKKVAIPPRSFKSIFFPAGKHFFQFPAVQLAAAAVVVIGVFLFLGNPLNEKSGEMAVNDQINVEDISTDDHEIAGGELAVADSVVTVENPAQVPAEEGELDNLASDDNGQASSPEFASGGTVNGATAIEISEKDMEISVAPDNDETVTRNRDDNGVGVKDELNGVNVTTATGYSENADGNKKTADLKQKTKEEIEPSGIMGGSALAKESAKADEMDDRGPKDQREQDVDKVALTQPNKDVNGDTNLYDAEKLETVTLDESEIVFSSQRANELRNEKGKNDIWVANAESPASGVVTEDLKAPARLNVGSTSELKALFFTVK